MEIRNVHLLVSQGATQFARTLSSESAAGRAINSRSAAWFLAALVTSEHHEMKVTIIVFEDQCYAGGAATVARATCPDRPGITCLTSPECHIRAPAEE